MRLADRKILLKTGITPGDDAYLSHFWYREGYIWLRLCDGDTCETGAPPHAEYKSKGNCDVCIRLYVDDQVSGRAKFITPFNQAAAQYQIGR